MREITQKVDIALSEAHTKLTGYLTYYLQLNIYNEMSTLSVHSKRDRITHRVDMNLLSTLYLPLELFLSLA